VNISVVYYLLVYVQEGMAENEETWKDWIESYIKQFVIYVAKDPKDFFVRLVFSADPLIE
jgi:hypothetical protein